MKTEQKMIIALNEFIANKKFSKTRLSDEEKTAVVMLNTIIVMMSGRIPDPFDDFNQYVKITMSWIPIEDTITHLTNGGRLGMGSVDVGKCAGWLSRWTSGDALNPKIYEDQANKLTKNRTSSQAYYDFEQEFNNWFHRQLDIMAASPNKKEGDMELLHIKEKPTKRHRNTTPIADVPFVIAQPSGPGCIKLKNRTAKKAKRPSLCKHANGVEITYACISKEPCPTAIENQGKWKATAPANPDDCTYRETQTKATFEVEVSVHCSGLLLKGWSRFINTHNRKLDGNWSQPFEIHVP